MPSVQSAAGDLEIFNKYARNQQKQSRMTRFAFDYSDIPILAFDLSPKRNRHGCWTWSPEAERPVILIADSEL